MTDQTPAARLYSLGDHFIKRLGERLRPWAAVMTTAKRWLSRYSVYSPRHEIAAKAMSPLDKEVWLQQATNWRTLAELSQVGCTNQTPTLTAGLLCQE